MIYYYLIYSYYYSINYCCFINCY